MPLTDEALQKLYAWIDQIPLSRPKRNFARDFSDGVLTAEVIAFYLPRLVQKHNYTAANSSTQKKYNWNTMNQKVLKKLGFHVSSTQIDDIVAGKAGAIEEFLSKLQIKIANYAAKSKSKVTTSGGSSQEQEHETRLGSPSSKAGVQDFSSVPTPPPASSARVTIEPLELNAEINQELLIEKETKIQELKETVQILELKVQKLEQLVRIKDTKIQTLVEKLEAQHEHTKARVGTVL